MRKATGTSARTGRPRSPDDRESVTLKILTENRRWLREELTRRRNRGEMIQIKRDGLARERMVTLSDLVDEAIELLRRKRIR